MKLNQFEFNETNLTGKLKPVKYYVDTIINKQDEKENEDAKHDEYNAQDAADEDD